MSSQEESRQFKRFCWRVSDRLDGYCEDFTFVETLGPADGGLGSPPIALSYWHAADGLWRVPCIPEAELPPGFQTAEFLKEIGVQVETKYGST